MSDLVGRHDLVSNDSERRHGERRPQPRAAKRASDSPLIAGEPRSLNGRGRDVARRMSLFSWRISVEQRKRYGRDREHAPESEKRTPPAHRRDKPGVDRVEGNSATRVASAQHPHRRPSRPYEPPRHDRRRRDDQAGDPGSAEDPEAYVVLRK